MHNIIYDISIILSTFALARMPLASHLTAESILKE